MAFNPAVDENFPVAEVYVDREIRQRTVLKGIEELAAGIERDGLLHPIVVHEDGKLVAGERRLAAHKHLKRDTIRATILERLPVDVAYRLELQENLQRRQLSWHDECRAVGIYHRMREQLAPGWTHLGTANDLGISRQSVTRYLTVAPFLGVPDAERIDQEVVDCQTLDGALNLIKGRAERANAAAAARGLEVAGATVRKSQQKIVNANMSAEEKSAAIAGLFGKRQAEPEAQIENADMELIEAGRLAEEALQDFERKAAAAHDQPIITASFVDWIEQYDGPAFDVLHVDFPWGKGYAGSNTRKTGRAHVAPTYADSPDVHWELLETLLTWQDKLAMSTAHMIYWFDHDFFEPIKTSITNAGWKLVQPHPLIWHKPYQGNAADPKRRPRHTYEAAFLFSRGDRKLVKLDQDVFVGRKEESLHINQKSEEMLAQFLGMLVNEQTAVFDPTCGSGSALAVARRLGSPRVLGIEIDPENADVARHVLQRGDD